MVTLRRFFRQKSRAILLLVMVSVVTLSILHRLVLPSLIGYYEDECLLSDTKYEALKKLFQRIATLYDKLNQVYWVDYGLLLGYYRIKDVLPHDGDLDFTRVHFPSKEFEFNMAFYRMMREFPETRGNTMFADMYVTGKEGERVHVTADLFRVQVEEINDKKFLFPYWNEQHREAAR